jgi:predicted pyridoxine 5'-phosphate oxidase superfamily flavin-nucleotide-binding protein
MGKTFDAIGDDHREFMESQQMFFVASAPLSADGHVNVSPKGLDTFRILGTNRVAYLDLTGSGNETAAHLLENGRITLLFCAFHGSPKILRLYGKGRTIPIGEHASLFPEIPGARQIVEVTVERVQTSCGYGVPVFSFEHQRDTLVRWAEAKGDEGLDAYRRQKNATSIDGLPASR